MDSKEFLKNKVFNDVLKKFKNISEKNLDYKNFVKELCDILISNKIFKSASFILFVKDLQKPEIIGKNNFLNEISELSDIWKKILNYLDKITGKKYIVFNEKSTEFEDLETIYHLLSSEKCILYPIKRNKQNIGYLLGALEKEFYEFNEISLLIDITLNFLVQRIEIMEKETIIELLNRSLNMWENEIYITRKNSFKFLYVNDSASNNLGYTKEELLSMTPANVSSDFLKYNLKDAIENLNPDNNDKLQFESIHIRKDGSTYPYEITISAEKVNDDVFYIGNVKNIENIFVRQKDLISHFKKYQSLFEESPIAFIELDYSEIFEEISTSFIDVNIEKFIEENIEKYVDMVKIVTCNTAALEIFECSTKDELSEKISYLCCSYKENLKYIILNFLSNNQYVAMETGILTAKNNMKYIKLRASVLTYEYREYDRIFVSLIDISERKMTEFELKKFQTALEENPFSVVITDNQGRIEYVNKKFTEITGYFFTEVKGKNPRILQSGKTEKNVYESLWKTILSGKVWKGVFINKRKNGELFWENATIAPVINCDGVIKNFIALKEDITKQRKLEEMYVQSQKLEALGSLASGIAHDFNNVLTVILSYTDYAKQILKESDEMYLPINEIDNAAKKASEIVTQLLEFSKKDNETPQIVNVNDEIEKMKKMLSRILGEDIKIKYNFTKQSCFAFIDRGKFSQILMNLIINAKEAFDEKHKPHIIEIFTNIRTFENVKINYERILNGKYVEIKVKDNGPGIPKEILPKIFEPFYTTKSKGSGLGLSTISKVINKAGGYIYVESELNIGTTFTILLPYVEFEADLIENENFEESILSGNESILIVEDDTSLRNIVCRVLRKLGYHMFEASTAAEAISIINRINIDLIIMDIVLPDKSGTELLKIIKKEKGDVKFVFISGYPENVLIEKFNLNFNDNFLSKPFNSNTLLKKIRNILDGT